MASAYALTDAGTNPVNEDSHLIDNTKKLYVVADGIGRSGAGGEASQTLVECLNKAIPNRFPQVQNRGIYLRDTLKSCLKEFREKAQTIQQPQMATTLTLLNLEDDMFHVLQVGDSRGYIFRDGQLRQITNDHSVAYEQYMVGAITKDEIRTHPNQKFLTRTVRGDQDFVVPDIFSEKLEEGDIFLLCSDGITNILSDMQLENALIEHSNPKDIAEAIVEMTLARNPDDNLTVVAISQQDMDLSYDKIYAEPQEEIAQFSFNQEVTQVFANMLERSVPGYNTIIANIGEFAAQYAQAGTNCYDLGCSLGTATRAMAQKIPHSCQIIAVDNSAPMIEVCRKNFPAMIEHCSIEIRYDDICHTEIQNASVVVLNFTLQFVSPENRQALLQKIFDGMVPGGILVLSEKIRDEDKMEEWRIELHHNFKRAQGYSDLEIEQKKKALKGFMITDTGEIHHQRLQDVGFKRSIEWFRCFNFISILAEK